MPSSATVAIQDPTLSSSVCTGTLITPGLVLTAAHCVLGYPDSGPTRIVYQPPTGPVQTRTFSGCFLHPDATAGFHRATCAEMTSTDPILSGHDLAILVLSSPIAGARPRSLAPPQTCVHEHAEPIVLRGLAGRPIAQRRRLAAVGRTRAAGTFQADGIVMEDRAAAGDSGGTWTEEWRDARGGPVISLLSTFATVRLSERVATGPFVWDASNQAWLWGVLDPDGTCALGSTTPCTLRDGTVSPDFDGDGLPDARDLCPTVAPIATTDGQHTDTDGDFHGDDCDVDPGFCDWDDRDRDGLTDRLDPCPTIPEGRHSTSDLDGDGVFDACDQCAFGDDRDPTLDLVTDADRDGRPDACENCPSWNPSQADCNLEAEQAVFAACSGSGCARGEVFRGDRCDPTPCGQAQIGLESDLTRRRLDIDARASISRGDARTGYRFCRCTPARRGDTTEAHIRCREEERPDPAGHPDWVIGNCGSIDIGTYDLRSDGATLEPSTWRWTTLQRRSDPSARLDAEYPARYAPTSFGFAFLEPPPFEPDITASWHLLDDIARWQADIPGEPDGPIAGIEGVGWIHTPGATGGGAWTTPRERELASHFWSGSMPLAGLHVPPPPPCQGAIGPLLMTDDLCLVCGSELPVPWLAYGGIPRCVEVDRSAPFILFGDRAFDIQPGLEVPGVEAFAAQPDARWIAAAETGSWLGRDSIRYAAVSPTLQITQVLWLAPGLGLRPVGKAQCPPGQECAPQLLAADAELEQEAPPARTGAAIVLSATRGRVFVIGGTSGGGDLTDAWSYDVDAQVWEPLPTPIPLGRVLAATYSAPHDALVVVDEITRHHHSRARRLLMLDPNGRAGRVLASWPRIAPTDQFELSAEPEGALYLAASHARGRVHAVLAISLEPSDRAAPTSARIRGIAIGRGAIGQGGLRASERGVTVVVDDPVRGAVPIGYAPGDFRPDGRASERAF